MTPRPETRSIALQRKGWSLSFLRQFKRAEETKKNVNVKIWLILAGFTSVGALYPASTIAGTGNFHIAAIQSKPHGHSYSEWAATWWQWALGQPASVNPVTDLSGQFCATGQKGTVWFLAGTFGTPPTVSRTCTVPTGQALFFPVIDAFYGAFLNDPPEMRTPDFIRSQVDCAITSVQVQIDGVFINNARQYFLGPQKSLLFDVQLPTDNIFGLGSDVIPELLLSPSADSGIYLFLDPLPPGKHALHWKASETCPFGDSTQDITYELTVQPHANGKSAPTGHGKHIP
jgi:hypothetical protein